MFCDNCVFHATVFNFNTHINGVYKIIANLCSNETKAIHYLKIT